MPDNYTDLDYFDLQALFIAKNKAFTEALRLRKPAPVLQTLYSELDIIFQLIKEKRSAKPTLAES